MTFLESRFLYVIGGRDSMSEAPLESIERLDCYQEFDQQRWELLNLVNKDN